MDHKQPLGADASGQYESEALSLTMVSANSLS